MRQKLNFKKCGIAYYGELWKYPKDFNPCWCGDYNGSAGFQKGIWEIPISKEFWKNSYV